MQQLVDFGQARHTYKKEMVEYQCPTEKGLGGCKNWSDSDSRGLSGQPEIGDIHSGAEL